MSNNQISQLKPLVFVSLPNSGSELLRNSISTSDSFSGPQMQFQSNTENAVTVVSGIEKLLATTDESNISGKPKFAIIDVTYAALLTANVPGASANGNRDDVFSWLVESQYPVVHVVRENVLDCAIQEYASKTTEPTCDASAIISRIGQMKQQVETVRRVLENANLIEFKYEKIRQPIRKVSSLPIRQLHKFLGIEFDADQLNLDANIESADENVANLKLMLRPELTRSGLGNMYDLPKAA